MPEQAYVLVDADSPPDIRPDIENSMKIFDYHTKYIKPQVVEHISSASRKYEFDRSYQAVEHGILTRGQWLLIIITGFYGQVCNGGVLQYFDNCTEQVFDVPDALKILELHEFRRAYIKLAEQVVDELKTGHLSDKRKVLMRLWDLTAEERKVIGPIIDRHAKDSGIDHHFRQKWDDQKRELYWPPDLWSQQMLARTIEYVEAHPSDFCKLQS